MAAEPAANRPWHIEQNGANPVAPGEQGASVQDLFWVWFGGNLAITGLVVGAVVMSYGLSLAQGLLALAGVFSFVLIGWFAVPGARHGIPTMVLSRASFGTRGNLLPSLVSWLNLVGWETVVLVVATYALEAAFQAAFGLNAGTATLVLSLVVVMVVAFSVALLGHATLVRVQTAFSYLFGALTLVVAAVLWHHIDWTRLVALPAGSWTKSFVPAFSIVLAATGLSWVNTAADYSRYLSRNTPSRRIVGATVWGSVIPAMAIMVLGVFLYGSLPALATSANPIGLLERELPAGLAVPYLLTAVGSMVTGDIMDIYSSGLSLLAAEVPIPRYRTVMVDAVVSVGASLYILFVAQNFIGSFEAFLTLLAAVLSPWAAIYLLDLGRLRDPGLEVGELYTGARSRFGAFRWPALTAWLVGLLVALALTSTSLWSGPLAVGIFQGSDLGFLAGFAVTAGLYALWRGQAGLRRQEAAS
jgi:NCS1 family nucleobase:cation symporter-1